MQKLIKMQKDEISMTTLEIAEQTGKKHKHVMRDVRNMFKSLGKDLPKNGEQKDESIFEHIYLDKYNREWKCYKLPKREILILVSGYSVKLRAAIIDKLEELEKDVKILTPAEQFLQTAQLLVGLERKQIEMEKRVELTEDKINKIESNLVSDSGYFTITGYANLINVPVSNNEANKMGRRASLLSREDSIPIGKTNHERWGQINTYHEDILKSVFFE